MRYSTRHPWSYFLQMLIAGTILASCNDSPTTIGSGYLPENVEFHTYTFRPQDFHIESGISAASNSSAEKGIGIAVGSTEDGITAHGLIAITSESATLADPNAAPVTGASLMLRTSTYRYGATDNRQIDFDVVVLDQVFSINTKWNDGLAGSIESAPAIGTFSGSFTDSTFITIPLELAAATKFLDEYYRWDTITVNGKLERQFRTLKSLALRAKTGGKLIGTFLGVQGIPDSLRPLMKVTLQDGKTANLGVGTTNWIVKGNVDPGEGNFAVMAGVPIRTLIRLDLDSIPDGATIHQADLKLFADTSRSRHGTLGPTTYLVAYLATDTSFLPASYLISGRTGVIPVNRLAADETSFSNVFRFTTLSPIIAAWLRTERGRDSIENHGLILAYNREASGANLETSTVDRVIFHGPDAADPSVRPSLTIIYSIKVDASK